MVINIQFILTYSTKIFQKHINLNQTCNNRNSFTAIPFSLILNENNSFKETFPTCLLSGTMSLNKVYEKDCVFGIVT